MHNTEKGQSQNDGQSQKGQSPKNMDGSLIDQKDDPIVALEPEDNLKQGSAFMGSKKSKGMGEP